MPTFNQEQMKIELSLDAIVSMDSLEIGKIVQSWLLPGASLCDMYLRLI